MADVLTPQQRQAVIDRGGNLLVSAAAGSGKTKVLVDRLMTYLTDSRSPADLDSFLIITYTKAAASELRGKIAAKLTERIAEEPDNRHLQKQMQRLYLTKISTVHGFCSDILREYAYKLDIAADFRVADENECREIRHQVMESLLDEAYEHAENDQQFRSFVDTQGLGRSDKLVPQIIEKVYDSARCHLNPDDWLEKCCSNVSVEDITDVSESIWGEYLIRRLHTALDCEIKVIGKCAELAECCDGMEKPAMNLRDTLYQLEALRQKNCWDEIAAAKNIDYGRLTFPRKNPDPELSERIKAARTACKKHLDKHLQCFTDASDQVLQDLRQSQEAVMGLVTLVRRFGKRYEQAKRGLRCVDFGDLEHKTLDLLLGKSRSGPTAASVEIGSRYREILVDEYQDSNRVQDAIFEALTKDRHNCFMVGDVKQSIYQFRLADPTIFLDKYEKYVPAEQAQDGYGRKILLNHNFRSGGEVIEGVNHVFSTCMRPWVGGLHYTEGESLREGVYHKPLTDPGVELHCLQIRDDTYEEEAAYVAEKIDQMLREQKVIRKGDQFVSVQPDDIVILLRSPGSVGRHFQHALEARGIRCSSGSGVNLLQTQEIATLRSFLETIVNPRQDIPLLSILASPVFGFSADDLAAIRGKKKRGSIYDSLLESNIPKVNAFLYTLRMLRREARMNNLTALLESCFALTKMDSVYAAMPGGDARRANLQTFFEMAAAFENGGVKNVSQFLDHLRAMEEKGLVHESKGISGTVTIMSIHKSKGLEFPVVFLCGLSRSFNRESMQAQILCDKQLGLGLSVADQQSRIRYPSVAKRAIAARMLEDSISEEMRVLYVAMTRARDRLIMTYASRNLESDLQDTALRMDFDQGDLICRNADCPGDWVLLAAMQRTEAGALHALGGKPNHTILGSSCWNILVSDTPESKQTAVQKEEDVKSVSDSQYQQIRQGISFSYPHEAATKTQSKQTATGRKGRIKDEEAAENTQEQHPSSYIWRKPSFSRERVEGKTYGNAIHAAMQYIHYGSCENYDGVVQEIHRLVEQGYLSQEQGDMVDCRQIAVFFASDIGRKLCFGAEHLREFKFSILDDGSNYGDNLEGEKVLLQGVVDCALIEEDGITVIDFKTDHVMEHTLQTAVEKYSTQVRTYASALSRIYEMPVKAKYLYFFRLGAFIPVI